MKLIAIMFSLIAAGAVGAVFFMWGPGYFLYPTYSENTRNCITLSLRIPASPATYRLVSVSDGSSYSAIVFDAQTDQGALKRYNMTCDHDDIVVDRKAMRRIELDHHLRSFGR